MSSTSAQAQDNSQVSTQNTSDGVVAPMLPKEILLQIFREFVNANPDQVSPGTALVRLSHELRFEVIRLTLQHKRYVLIMFRSQSYLKYARRFTRNVNRYRRSAVLTEDAHKQSATSHFTFQWYTLLVSIGCHDLGASRHLYSRLFVWDESALRFLVNSLPDGLQDPALPAQAPLIPRTWDLPISVRFFNPLGVDLNPRQWVNKVIGIFTTGTALHQCFDVFFDDPQIMRLNPGGRYQSATALITFLRQAYHAGGVGHGHARLAAIDSGIRCFRIVATSSEGTHFLSDNPDRTRRMILECVFDLYWTRARLLFSWVRSNRPQNSVQAIHIDESDSNAGYLQEAGAMLTLALDYANSDYSPDIVTKCLVLLDQAACFRILSNKPGWSIHFARRAITNASELAQDVPRNTTAIATVMCGPQQDFHSAILQETAMCSYQLAITGNATGLRFLEKMRNRRPLDYARLMQDHGETDVIERIAEGRQLERS